MADGVAITAGSGTTVATDDAGAPGHVQLFKIAVDTNGSATLVPASATDGLAVDITRHRGLSTAAVASVTAAVADTTLDASNAARLGLVVYNNSTGTLHLKYGTGASLTSFTVKVLPDQLWEMPPGSIYTGAVNGYWDVANGAALVTELTA